MRNFFRTLAPEKFDASVTVRADGNYRYAYDGILIFVPALIEACRAGHLSDRVDGQLADAAAQLQREGFRHVQYLGRGRYSVTLERNEAKGKPSYFPSREMPLLSIRPQADGTTVIRGSRPDASAPCQLIGTDAEINGQLTVTLEEGAKALNHNAQSQPPTKDSSTRYIWRIKSPEDDAWIVVVSE